MATSPFPGMDPWVERQWGDVHQAMITYLRDQVRGYLPKGLIARMQDRVYVEYQEGADRDVYPDIRVVEHPSGRAARREPASGSTAVAEPLIVHLQSEPLRESFIEILDPSSGTRVVTVIEILSLANKRPGDGQELYLQKQRELAAGGVSLVEIDLLRSGRRILNARPAQLPPEYRTTYQACIRRGHKPHVAEVFRVPLRERLPTIPIPLRPTDEDISGDLQSVFERAYENGDYDLSIDYKRDPDPPLSQEDAAWADELLRGKGLR